MAHRTSIDTAPGVAGVRQRIARWRATRPHRGGPMPAALWAAAVRLARRHGVGPTARALRVDQGTLTIRVGAPPDDVPAARPTFVEVGAAPAVGVGPSVIAVDGSGGRRLRLEVSDLRVPDLLALVHAAWEPEG
jgi:hypothetical protein